MKRQFKIWLECFRLRTLPVSISGVVIAIGLAVWLHHFQWVPAMLCLVFALLAQIASNTANEYFDYLHGADKPGRVGPRRGVTEGDIKPATLRNVTFALLALAAIVGCGLIPYGGWWLLPVGIVIVLGALAYSTGPYPLSYHGLGELMVFIFFGLVPVNLTFYVMAGTFAPFVVMFSIAIGLMGVNVLLVNNYRDVDDDRKAGKMTQTVLRGRPVTAFAYLINGFMAIAILASFWLMIAVGSGKSFQHVNIPPLWTLAIPVLYLVMHTASWYRLRHRDGTALNPLLGATARNMLIFTILITIVLIIYS